MVWYRLTLVLQDAAPRCIAGVSLPGTPVVVAGSNSDVAWGFTNSARPLHRLDPPAARSRGPARYRGLSGEWETAVEHDEWIQVKGARRCAGRSWRPAGDRRSRSATTPMAVEWIAYRPDATDLGLLGMETARDVGEALRVAQRAGVPTQNILVADRAGHIGWTLAGLLPLATRDLGRLSGRRGEGRRACRAAAAAAVSAVVDPPSGRLWTASSTQLGDARAPARDRRRRRGCRPARHADPRRPVRARQARRTRPARHPAGRPRPLAGVLAPAGAGRAGRVRADAASRPRRVSPRSAAVERPRRCRPGQAIPWCAISAKRCTAPGSRGWTSGCRRAPRSWRRRFRWAARPRGWKRSCAPWPTRRRGCPRNTPIGACHAGRHRRNHHAQLAARRAAGAQADWGERNRLAIGHAFAGHAARTGAAVVCRACPGRARGYQPCRACSGRPSARPNGSWWRRAGRRSEILEMPGGASGHPMSPFFLAGHQDWVDGAASPFGAGDGRAYADAAAVMVSRYSAVGGLFPAGFRFIAGAWLLGLDFIGGESAERRRCRGGDVPALLVRRRLKRLRPMWCR